MWLFKKNAKPHAVTPDNQAPVIVEVRSYGGFRNHFRLIGDEHTLCGYSDWLPTNSDLVVTSKTLAQMEPRAVKEYYCQTCVDRFDQLTDQQ